ncbi:hypothetical protein D0Z03_002868 [Geotrichum reessii]|nr:hypothetical protein D0Z03_002868 [Galactomyces reessii]
MLQDAHKPLTKTTALTGGLATPKSQPKISVSSRLSTAREKSLDYKLNPQKRSTTKDNQEELSGPTFKELYAERFTGISSMTNDFSAISSLATQRIEASIARGEFDVLPGRGEKTPVDPNMSSPYIDHTEYYLNNMLKKQGAAPVWIDRQGTVHSRTREFRTEAGRSWLTHAVHVVTDAHPGPTTASQAARRRLTAEIRADFRTHAATTTCWKTKHAGFHAAAVRDLNSAVRSYNLQAPSAARRGYLDVTTELDAAIESVLTELDTAIDKYVHGTEAAAAAKAQEERNKKLGWHQVTLNELPSLSGLLSAGKGSSAAADSGMPLPMELPPEKGLMKNLFKNLFKVEDIETLTLKKKGWR